MVEQNANNGFAVFVDGPVERGPALSVGSGRVRAAREQTLDQAGFPDARGKQQRRRAVLTERRIGSRPASRIA
jgi:hypothetical protein